MIQGSGGGASVYGSYVLPNVSLAAGDYYVVCGNAATVANCDLVVPPATNLIQNGAPDAVALRDPASALIDTVSYEGNTGSPYTETSGVGLVDSSAFENAGISRIPPDGVDTDVNNVDLSQRCITPGAANTSDVPPCVVIPVVSIGEIQGAGHISPYVGQTVTTDGVVTAVAFNGYYVQDPDGDGDPDTSDGMFVFKTGSRPSVGEYLQLTDVVTEFNGGAEKLTGLSAQQAKTNGSEVSDFQAEPRSVSIS